MRIQTTPENFMELGDYLSKFSNSLGNITLYEKEQDIYHQMYIDILLSSQQLSLFSWSNTSSIAVYECADNLIFSLLAECFVDHLPTPVPKILPINYFECYEDLLSKYQIDQQDLIGIVRLILQLSFTNRDKAFIDFVFHYFMHNSGKNNIECLKSMTNQCLNCLIKHLNIHDFYEINSRLTTINQLVTIRYQHKSQNYHNRITQWASMLELS